MSIPLIGARLPVAQPVRREIITEENKQVLRPIERSAIARYADYAGYVPGIGSAVGAARLVSSVVIGIFALIAGGILALVGSSHSEKVLFIARRCGDEAVRGFSELIPGFTILKDWCRKKEEMEGRIHSTAFGKYIYDDPRGDAFLCYSQQRHEGPATFHFDNPSSGIDGVTAHFAVNS